MILTENPLASKASWKNRLGMDKLKLTGRNLGRVFDSRLSRACIGRANVHITKQPNLKLKTRPEQLLGSLPLAFALPGLGELLS